MARGKGRSGVAVPSVKASSSAPSSPLSSPPSSSGATAAAPKGTRSFGVLRMILNAASRVLGCASAQVALVDAAREALVIRVGIANREVPRLSRVESLLGFSPDGFAVSLVNDASVVVRAFREGRMFVTARFGDIAGNLLDEDLIRQIQRVLGPLTFAVVPVPGRMGPLGVILFIKVGSSGFVPADRDLLLAYADRVGAALESQQIDAGVEALGSFGDVGSPPPTIHLCDEQLRLLPGQGEPRGASLHAVLHAAGGEALLHEPVARMQAMPDEPALTLALLTDDGRSLRLTLRRLPSGFAAVSEDVGWLERLGREAARSRDFLAKVLGSATDALLTLDTDGAILSVNETARPTLGLPSEALLGRPIAELLADARARRRAEKLFAAVAADGFGEAELPFLRAGRRMPAAVSALLLADAEGRPTGSLWRVRDLTERRRGDEERKRLRAKLLQSERLSALGEMAARIAHEVRNPLVSIGAAAQVVEEELDDGSPLREEVRAISREVRRLDAIVTGFLHFARPPKAGRALVEVGHLLVETVDLLRVRSGDLTLSVSAAGSCRARCDADSIRQVLWNVLVNAVEASPAAGSVTCEVRERKGRVVIAISDEGPGVPPAIRKRVFDPFFSTKARGTGLGLAVSKQILDEHHGRIRLLKRKSGGTSVVIDLPS